MKIFNGIKFLVVDDDELLREVLAEVLYSRGAEVTEAKNGDLAFTLVKKNHYDVVISDVRMPGGDGLTLAKNISELSGDKPLVFICSGFSDLSIDDAKKLNILKVFEKPFEHQILINEISSKLPLRSLKKSTKINT